MLLFMSNRRQIFLLLHSQYLVLIVVKEFMSSFSVLVLIRPSPFLLTL